MSYKELPNDRDGRALKKLQDEGYDLDEPLHIDFIIVIPNETAAFTTGSVVSLRGYTYRIEADEDYADFLCICTRCMIPDYQAIVDSQSDLDQLVRPFGGYADGWEPTPEEEI